jgi:superfamily II DNA or RNA helicase
LKSKLDWNGVWDRVRELAAYEELWRSGQDRSLTWIARQLQNQPGVLIADEVGLGKTRLAIALAVCVAACGGRVAFLIPPGLTFQWRDEELRAFLRQLAGLALDWIPRDITSKVLRTYPDLFNGGKRAPSYPLSDHAQFLFVSHRFGLPQGLPGLRRQELWGLPFALKLKLLKDGRLVRHAKWLELSAGQTAAVDWLAGHLPERLREDVTGTVLPKVSTDVFKDPAASVLFRKLIGELVGDIDLVIIDEAHKSRAGASTRDDSDKKIIAPLQSRLTQCLDEIVLRCGSTSSRVKRLALTATPMEMDPGQWGAVFHRLGLGKAHVAGLKKTVNGFAEAVKAVRTGSAKEIERLAQASNTFQSDLQEVVTRRVWRDHPVVERFAQHSVQPEAAHPHRRFHLTTVALDGLSADARMQLAYAEGLAAASRGIASHATAKSAGSRHAQAMPLLSELANESMEREAAAVHSAGDDTASAAEHAKRQRQAYWMDALKRTSQGMGALSEQAMWSLQWHPKVRHAIDLIEGLTVSHHKVLVFAEFIAPMRALDRALNIRHYLTQVRDGKAVLLPAGLHMDDPDLQRWLRSPDLHFSALQIASFKEAAANLAARYSSERSNLREVCQKAAGDFFAQARSGPVRLQAGLMETLVTWLVQQLCAQEQLTVMPTKGHRGHIYEMVIERLHNLQDTDPAGQDDAGEADAERPFDWESVIREQETDLEKDQSGRYVFRMSPFSQRLYGETKPSTRRVRQSAFNNTQLHPRVLIGQSAVASEGLNLHHACRAVVLFHLDWNPGRIEQQIGRVDRQGSAWMNAFEKWECDGGAGEPPYIDIHTIALEGTYDALRTEVVNERAKILRSQLFGEILPAEQLQGLPEEARVAIGAINVDFRP